MFKDFLRPIVPLFTFVAFMAAMKLIDLIQHWPTH